MKSRNNKRDKEELDPTLTEIANLGVVFTIVICLIVLGWVIFSYSIGGV